ncbi:UBC-like protein [Neolentinus lepideus HHB14362 ss-1]|uniref:UBC-like protein n=1 Tax=Neolentinus lepideus HHB14362 ss-1 TaxID=1314782 RepID=A0A165UR30_9AGAM|nr:UBC-like protein [Neolentinus lepideus HHB14362 ss-1]
MTSFNRNNSAVKRIMQEARELANDPSTDYSAAPLEDDIFEWHCTLRGPPGTEFEGGLYHFRILLPPEYPFRPPSIMMLTPSGRFELNTKICISFTNYHEELWQPAWGVRTAIVGLQGFFALKGQAAVGVGSLEYHAAERKRLAVLSRDWTCPVCNRSNLECLPDPATSEAASWSSGSNTNDTSAVCLTTTTTPVAEPVIAAPDLPEPVIARPPSVIASPTAIRGISLSTDSTISSRTSRTETPSPEPDNPTESNGGGPSAVENRGWETRGRSTRPPLLLDMAICVLLILVFALICRRVF